MFYNCLQNTFTIIYVESLGLKITANYVYLSWICYIDTHSSDEKHNPAETCFFSQFSHRHPRLLHILTLIARFMGPTTGPSGADRTQVGPMFAPRTFGFSIILNSFYSHGLRWQKMMSPSNWPFQKCLHFNDNVGFHSVMQASKLVLGPLLKKN